jgi:hypothetical protein
MAEETIEVTETVTEEKELTICDECSREVDPNGIKFEPSDVDKYIAEGDIPEIELDFCSECLDKLTNGEVKPENVSLVDEWLNSDTSVTHDAYSLKDGIEGDRKMAISLLLMGIISLIPAYIFNAWLIYGIFGLFAVVVLTIFIDYTHDSMHGLDNKL